MIYRVVFYDRSTRETWAVGVYANNDDQAKQIGAILISRAHGYQVSPEQLKVIQIPSLTSDQMTTT